MLRKGDLVRIHPRRARSVGLPNTTVRCTDAVVVRVDQGMVVVDLEQDRQAGRRRVLPPELVTKKGLRRG